MGSLYCTSQNTKLRLFIVFFGAVVIFILINTFHYSSPGTWEFGCITNGTGVIKLNRDLTQMNLNCLSWPWGTSKVILYNNSPKSWTSCHIFSHCSVPQMWWNIQWNIKWAHTSDSPVLFNVRRQCNWEGAVREPM